MPLPIKITLMREDVMLTEARQPVAAIRVDFIVGNHGPFSRLYPKLGFNDKDARADMEAFARTVENMMR